MTKSAALNMRPTRTAPKLMRKNRAIPCGKSISFPKPGIPYSKKNFCEKIMKKTIADPSLSRRLPDTTTLISCRDQLRRKENVGPLGRTNSNSGLLGHDHSRVTEAWKEGCFIVGEEAGVGGDGCQQGQREQQRRRPEKKNLLHGSVNRSSKAPTTHDMRVERNELKPEEAERKNNYVVVGLLLVVVVVVVVDDDELKKKVVSLNFHHLLLTL